MENPQPQEHNLPSEDSPEAVRAKTMELLRTRAGFVETPELIQAKDQLYEAYTADNTEGVREAIALYHNLGVELVEQKQGDDYIRAQIGLIIAMCLLRIDVRRIDEYKKDLVDAITYAINMGFDDLVSVIEDIEKQASAENQEALTPSQEIAAVLADIGEEHGFDEETCVEIAEQPFEEAFENAYNYLMQAGLDADEVLAAFTESSDQPMN